MKSCPRCGRQNEDDVQFCGRCGLNIVEYEKHQTRPSSDDTMFCYRHPKEATNLSCGRCGKPICTKCAIIGPAGPRCPECAKNNIAFRPAAVIYGAKKGASSFTRMGPWGIYLAVMILVTIIGAFSRSCGRTSVPMRGPGVSRPAEEQQDENGQN